MGRFYKKSKIFRTKQLFKKCQFCINEKEPDYEDIETLDKYTHESGKITPKKMNGNCTKHQRKLARVIKRARFLALLPFARRIRKS